MRKHIKMFLAVVLSLSLLILLSCKEASLGWGALDDALDMGRVNEHLIMLQSLADQNHGNRAPSTTGSLQAGQYLIAQLEAAGYLPTIQEFDYSVFSEASPPVFEQVAPLMAVYPPNDTGGFMTSYYSGPGDVVASVQPVGVVIPISADSPPDTSSSGCEPEAFADFVPGKIALLQRGTCYFLDKVANAEAAGAVGVILFNEGQTNRTDAFVVPVATGPLSIPVVFANYRIAEALYQQIQNGQDVRVHLKVDAVFDFMTTFNVLAETTGGDAAHTVLIGAHHDSVAEGPGINDNGTGVAALLELARLVAESGRIPRNQIRFAFWGAEEEGLLGSEFYVDNLSPEELAKISLYLNVDMIGSPNFIRFVYDGDGSNSPDPGPLGSAHIEALLLNYFAAQGLPIQPTPIDGSSDYGSFADRGIPVGGIYSGSSEIKTESQVAIYGGMAGEVCDPNYHTRWDSLENVNTEVVEQIMRAFAFALDVYGHSPLEDMVPRATRRADSPQVEYRARYKGPYTVR